MTGMQPSIMLMHAAALYHMYFGDKCFSLHPFAVCKFYVGIGSCMAEHHKRFGTPSPEIAIPSVAWFSGPKEVPRRCCRVHMYS